MGDEMAAHEVAVDLVRDMGPRGLQGGPLVNSAAAGAMTLIHIRGNKHHTADGTGVRVAGVLSRMKPYAVRHGRTARSSVVWLAAGCQERTCKD